MAKTGIYNIPNLRKSLKLAQEMGLKIAGFEVTGEGGFRVMTASETANTADAAVEQWKRGQRGKD
jgi:hypothetical protein